MVNLSLIYVYMFNISTFILFRYAFTAKRYREISFFCYSYNLVSKAEINYNNMKKKNRQTFPIALALA